MCQDFLIIDLMNKTSNDHIQLCWHGPLSFSGKKGGVKNSFVFYINLIEELKSRKVFPFGKISVTIIVFH